MEAPLRGAVSDWLSPDHLGSNCYRLRFDFVDWLLQTLVWLPRLVAAAGCGSEFYFNMCFGHCLFGYSIL